MNSCKDCRHARWEFTKNGRVNPHKVGLCTWQKTVYVPLSSASGITGGKVELRGGYIWRKSPREKCPTYQAPLLD